MSNVMSKLAEAYAKVNEKKTLDPVDQNALKGKHADRKDKDIDNDGDVDSSDKYLHNRRKTVSKAMKKEGDVEMNPTKKRDTKMGGNDMAENTLPPVYARIIENREKRMKGATAPEGIMDKESPKSKEFVAKHTGEVKDPEPTAVDDLNKAARTPSAAPKRPADRSEGDKTIINPAMDVTKSGAK